MGLDDFYLDRDGSNQVFGYFSVAVRASLPLRFERLGGDWYLSASFEWLRLVADSTISTNAGDEDQFIGRIGIGLRY